ncbi:hypothetical protein [uncultured Aeromicrobium sp.]|uniref:hypothetical protein n=1 Tax=uncultured Aeromicrobium sp. TaxID=337820 RepID=UPI0025D1DE6C|nr:hypothetical protein [uncultured Aeromicrobium sp.]
MTDDERDRRARQRRAAALLGDLLPDTTSDERDPGEVHDRRSRDADIQSDRPPHYGRD